MSKKTFISNNKYLFFNITFFLVNTSNFVDINLIA